ncbi:flagellar motor switch protein FliG [Dermatobacter hominis]|uniref:flagellar motor switch protein FliG n=1 Tax=Dermatobacter hominis TaxID=2884263 RepID=UPI001D124A05|nr:flagellar motor switch protein FliG [Dermatobacter hominis]UDY37180.1 flagellar motor switch protein FliG [Dermatobacter hominis]
MSTVAPGPSPALSGPQKSAVLLMSLGTERAARVLRQLDEDEITAIVAEVTQLRDVPADVVDEVLDEFEVSSRARRHLATGGIEVARELLEASLGSDRSGEIVERLSMSFVSAPFECVRRVDPRMLLSFIRDEHPQTIALVIAHMQPEAAAMVLSGLPETTQRDVAVRVALMDRTAPDVVAVVEGELERRLSSFAQAGDLSSAGGVQSLVEVLNRSDRATERLIFDGLEEHDADLADEVRSRMFVFEDIVGLDDQSVQQILRRVDTKDLALALKGVREEVRVKVTSNLSQRAAETLDEDIALLGAVRLTAVEAAQGEVVRVIRQLEDAGDIVLARSGEEFVE